MDYTNLSTDEKNYLNSNAGDVTKEQFLSRILLHLMGAYSSNDEIMEDIVVDMLAALRDKVVTMSLEEWENLQEELPFRDVQYSSFDGQDFYELNDVEP